MKFSLLYTIAFAATAMAGTIGTADSYTEREVARALAEATENELLGRQSCNYNQVCTNHASCGSGCGCNVCSGGQFMVCRCGRA